MADRAHSGSDTGSNVAANGSQDPAADGSIDIASLVLDHHQKVFGYAFRLAGNAADAEDLTQQAFLIAQQKLHQIREPAKARSWLYAVVRSCYLKAVRKRQPTPAVNLELNVDQIPADLDDSPVDGQRLKNSIDRLPPEFRVVLVMFYFEERSYREIADQLELPIGTVMSRLSRAKGRLRQALLDSDTVEAQ